MAGQSRRWKARNLFPRATALWIQSRRVPHHARLRVHSRMASPSLWTTSVMAGGLAIILTLLLFVVGPPPEVALRPIDTPGDVESDTDRRESAPAPSIQLSMHHGAFPVSWDDHELLLVQSEPSMQPVEFAFDSTAWTAAGERPIRSVRDLPGRSVGELMLLVADEPPLINSSDLPPASTQVGSAAHLEVAVEKVWSSDGGQREPLEYDIIVRNQSAAAVERVVIRDVIPDTGQVLDVEPPATVSSGGELTWHVGSMDAGTELRLNVTLLPQQAGLIETLTVADVQSRFGVMTRVSAPLVPEPTVETPEPSLMERESAFPDAVLPAGIAAEPGSVIPVDDEAPARAADEPVENVFPFANTEPDLQVPAEPITPAAPLEERPADVFPIEAGEPVPRPQPLLDSVARQPLLRVNSTSPEVVEQGEIVTTIYEITNEGTAAAENVMLTVHITDELLHRHGTDVRHRIDRLEPGESRRARLLTRARETGTATLDAALKHDNGSVDSELSYIRITTVGAAPANNERDTTNAAAAEPALAPDEILR